ncbi:hypothetical protein BDY19DRAFT_934903 [Irpex rosettiformis]|uniref:Uncharacterized protein n=1 Tax=Irpex rosettiformis TaxID=378272 RepID=A0ACB8UAH5_9APHY|nr:hypothetical protein BDY19DRAFT_934903 [Irpex rosettiformis]
MPAKYSHVKKRQPKKSLNGNGAYTSQKEDKKPAAAVGRNIQKPLSPVAQLERAIAQMLLIRFEQDIARLFSTHIYCVALLQIPTFMTRCLTVAGPGWVAVNADSEEIKDFFRGAIGMDLRQAGDRVATKSVLWSYTALRHFATSNNVPICRRRGLHSHGLLPYYPALKTHLETLQTSPPPAFSKPPHLGPLTEGFLTLEKKFEAKYKKVPVGSSEWDSEWKLKMKIGYERLTDTLWRVAQEFDVRGYGTVLREKLSSNWCDCGCSTDHLSEVCERTVKEGELESKVRVGKGREWDGRGSGVLGWDTPNEEDVWDVELDFVSPDPDEYEAHPVESDMTVGELMEWRYIRAEREKEQGNVAFKSGDYAQAVKHYNFAYKIEPEVPHYNLNLAAAYLKTHEWTKAEKACEIALGQHRSVKGYWRRAQARKAQGRMSEAVKDLRSILQLQPENPEAKAELEGLEPSLPRPKASKPLHESQPSSSPLSCSSSSAGPSSVSASSSREPSMQRRNTALDSDSFGFTRSYKDDFKLKISSLPITIDIPVNLPPLVLGQNDRVTRSSLASLPPPNSHTKLESFLYPSWERYMVQKVTK